MEAATLTVYNAARLRDAGRPFLTEAAICKIFSSEVAERVASLAVNLFGGYGFVKDYPVEKLYRDAKIGQIYEGTSNLQLQTIAKQILWVCPFQLPVCCCISRWLRAPHAGGERGGAAGSGTGKREAGSYESMCSAMTMRCTSEVP